MGQINNREQMAAALAGNAFNDTMMIEGVEGHETSDEREYYAAIQRQINRGTWGLQGSHGRTMMRAMENGYCMLGRNRAHDYYGNGIPARTDVEEGTKGSRGLVAETMGEEWATYMENLQ